MKYIIELDGEEPITDIEKILTERFGKKCKCRSVFVDNDKIESMVSDLSKGFWSDDLEAFEDNPQRSLIIWTANRIYVNGLFNGYRKATDI